MVERFVKKVKVRESGRGIVITLPAICTRVLGIKAGDKLEVYVDTEAEKIIYVKK